MDKTSGNIGFLNVTFQFTCFTVSTVGSLLCCPLRSDTRVSDCSNAKRRGQRSQLNHKGRVKRGGKLVGFFFLFILLRRCGPECTQKTSEVVVGLPCLPFGHSSSQSHLKVPSAAKSQIFSRSKRVDNLSSVRWAVQQAC